MVSLNRGLDRSRARSGREQQISKPDGSCLQSHGLIVRGETTRGKRSKRSAYVDPYLIALIYHGLHDHTATIDWLQKAAAVHSSLLFSILSDPMWQDSQQDPQLIAIVDKMESKAN